MGFIKSSSTLSFGLLGEVQPLMAVNINGPAALLDMVETAFGGLELFCWMEKQVADGWVAKSLTGLLAILMWLSSTGLAATTSLTLGKVC